DAHKHAGLALVGDARATLEWLRTALEGWAVDNAYREEAARLSREWDAEVARLYAIEHDPPAQSAVIGAVNDASRPQDVVVCAAGAMPGDLHKLWRTRDPKGYHVEYGYSCMGYEIAGGLGVKLAAPEREVYVMVGDGSYLMMPGEIVTAVQEGLKLTIVLVDSHGFNSIGGLSRSLGTNGFGTHYRYRHFGIRPAPFAAETGDGEIALVPLGGRCRVEAEGESWEIGGRASVFDGMPWALYLPRDTAYRVEPLGELELAICGAFCERR